MMNPVPALCILLLLLPMTCAAMETGVLNLTGDAVIITISTPGEGMDLWIDVVLPHAAVVGTIEAPAGIRSIRVKSAIGEVSCGNGTAFACSVPVSAGENALSVVAVDNQGNRAERLVNVTVHIGLPPPPDITVSGRVTAADGNPVSGADVVFESGIGLSWNKTPLRVTVVTGDDGVYQAENLIGYQQNVTVQKDGYLPFRSENIFENRTSIYDVILEPTEPIASGSILMACIPVLSAGLCLLLFRKELR